MAQPVSRSAQFVTEITPNDEVELASRLPLLDNDRKIIGPTAAIREVAIRDLTVSE